MSVLHRSAFCRRMDEMRVLPVQTMQMRRLVRYGGLSVNASFRPCCTRKRCVAHIPKRRGCMPLLCFYPDIFSNCYRMIIGLQPEVNKSPTGRAIVLSPDRVRLNLTGQFESLLCCNYGNYFVDHRCRRDRSFYNDSQIGLGSGQRSANDPGKYQ